MSDERAQVDENFESLKQLFDNMSKAMIGLEQRNAKLEEDIKALQDVNKSLIDSRDRIRSFNEKQLPSTALPEKGLDNIKLLKTELDVIKMDNLKTGEKPNSGPINIRQSYIEDKSSQNTLQNYNSLLQKKIAELENQLLINQSSAKDISKVHRHDCDKKISKLKIRNNALQLENKLLKEQLSNFRNLHSEVVSEIRLKNLNSVGESSRQEESSIVVCDSPTDVEGLDENELQPLQVNVIDFSDLDT